MGVTGKSATSRQSVSKRRVFYIPGYDPMLPRRYRELYRSEGAKQAAISGYDLKLEGRQGAGNYGWQVTSNIDGCRVETSFEFLLWSDIVQTSMNRSIAGTFVMLAHVVWIYVSTGALWHLTKLRKGPVIAALYPVFMLTLQLILGVLAGLLVFWGAGIWVHPLLGAVLGPLALGAVMVWFRRQDNRLYAYYLLHDYAFSARYYGANPPALEARMAQFADEIGKALEDDLDEGLVVGHSSGAHLGVSVLADLLRRTTPAPMGPRLAFLSLGQVVPMVSFLPKADRLRGDLRFLSSQKNLTWIDVTAPGDGCTFALVDPVGVSGVAPEEGQLWPRVISAAFSQTLSPALYKSLKWRFFRLHFQYLCAFDLPRDYDYFQITAGPKSLADRYRDRPQSPSRIVAPLSPYREWSAS